MSMQDKVGVGRMSADAGAFLECEVNTLITPDRTTVQLRSSGLGRAGIGRSIWKGLNTGHHEKALVRCPCSRLAALHGLLTSVGTSGRLMSVLCAVIPELTSASWCGMR